MRTIILHYHLFKNAGTSIDKILKERHKIRFLSANSYPKVGVINGLWANSFGNSGILHIESNDSFLSDTSSECSRLRWETFDQNDTC